MYKGAQTIKNHKDIYFFVVCAAVFYLLAGIAINPFILWTSLPLYIGYALLTSARASHSKRKLYASYGFNIVSVGFSIFYHLTWFLDWQGTKTGSSTSAILFIWLPMYAVILGFVGQFIGSFIGKVLDHN